MKALVTGASGFIGSTLIEELLADGFRVKALLRRTSSLCNLQDLNFEKVEGDVLDKDSLRNAVQGVDVVFHLAGLVAAPNRAAYFKANTEGTQNLAQAVAESCPGLKRFVHVSSLAAGGPSASLKERVEEQQDQPVSAYGESKLESERELLKFRETFPISIVRPPLVYGPKDKATFIFIQTVLSNVIPVFRGLGADRQKYFSSIHSRDLCRGMIQSAGFNSAPIPSGEIFYLSSNEKVTYEGLMGTIADLLGRSPYKIPMPRFALVLGAWGLAAVSQVTKKTYPLNVDKLNEIMPDYWICSNEKAKQVLGFNPRYEFKDGIAMTIEWYQKEKWF